MTRSASSRVPIEAIEAKRFDADAGVLGEALLERDAIGVVEADHAREAADRVVDEDVRRDHHVARGGDAVRARGRGARRRRRTSARRCACSGPIGGGDVGDRVGEIGEVEAVLGRVAVAGRIERDDGEAGGDERLRRTRRAASRGLPSRGRAGRSGRGPSASAATRDRARRCQRGERRVTSTIELARGGEDGALAVGARVAARRSEQSFGEARAEILGDDEGGLERGLASGGRRFGNERSCYFCGRRTSATRDLLIG